MAVTDMAMLAFFFYFVAGILASPLQQAVSINSTQLLPTPIQSSLLGPPKPVSPVLPSSPSNPIPPIPRPNEPACPPELGKPKINNCLAAAAAIPRDPRDNPVLRNYYIKASDRDASMENVELPYEITNGESFPEHLRLKDSCSRLLTRYTKSNRRLHCPSNDGSLFRRHPARQSLLE